MIIFRHQDISDWAVLIIEKVGKIGHATEKPIRIRLPIFVTLLNESGNFQASECATKLEQQE